MPTSLPFTCLSLAFGVFVGLFAVNSMEAKSDLENSVLACAREVALTGSSACEKAIAAKAQALKASASVFLPQN